MSISSRIFFIIALSPILNVELTSLRSGKAMGESTTSVVFAVFSALMVFISVCMVIVRRVLRRRKRN